MNDIKKSAKNGQMVSRTHRPTRYRIFQSDTLLHVCIFSQSAAKIQAKDLIRTRRYIQKFTQMRVQLQAVSLRMQSLRSNESMAVAMKGATRVRKHRQVLLLFCLED
jgi:hypothetical protein